MEIYRRVVWKDIGGWKKPRREELNVKQWELRDDS